MSQTTPNAVVNSLKGGPILRLLFKFGSGRLLWEGIGSCFSHRAEPLHSLLMSFSAESVQDPILH
jgi:hypothetical protein